MSLSTSEAMFKARRAQCQAKPPAKSFDICKQNCITLSSNANCGRCGNKCKQTESCVAATSGSFPYVCAAAAPPTWKGYAYPNPPTEEELVKQYKAACGPQFRPVRGKEGTDSCLTLDDSGTSLANRWHQNPHYWGSCGKLEGGQKVVNAPCVPRKNPEIVMSTVDYAEVNRVPSQAYYYTCKQKGARPMYTDEVPAGTPACTYWTVDRPVRAREGARGENMAYNKACEGKMIQKACNYDYVKL